MPERQAVPLNQMDVQVQGKQAGMQSRQAVQLGAPVASKGSGFLSALAEVTGEVLPVVNTELQRQIDLDKTEQVKRAFRKQGPSEDATLSGMAAYQLVEVDKQARTVNAGIATYIQDQFRLGNALTPEQIDEYTREQYNALFEMNPDLDNNKTISRYLTTRMQEAQPGLLSVEEKARAGWTQQQNLRGVESRIGELSVLDSSVAVQEELPKFLATSKAMNVSESEAYDLLVKWANVDAQRGDDKLLGALEANEATKYDTRLIQARNAYEQKMLGVNRVEIESSRSWAQAELMAGNMSLEQFDDYAKALQSQHGDNGAPAGWVKSVHDMYGNAQKEKKDELAIAGLLMYNQSKMPFGMNPQNSEETIKKATKATEEAIRKYYDDRAASGEITAEQAQVGIVQTLAGLSEKEQIVFPAIENLATGFLTINTKSYKNGQIPAIVTENLKVLSSLQPVTLSKYLRPEEQAQLNTYLELSKVMPEFQAMERMQTLRDNPRPRIETKDMQREVKNAVGKNIDTWLGTTVPKWQKDQLNEEAARIATQLYRTGTTEMSAAAKTASQLLAGRTTKTYNGTYIDAPLAKLQNAGFKDGKELDKSLEAFTLKNMDDFRKNSYDPNLTTKDVQYKFVNGMIYVKDKQGNLLDQPRPVADYLNPYRSARAEELRIGIEASKLSKMRPGALKVQQSDAQLDQIMPALIQQESGGKQSAVSSNGAVGVAQVMPGTGPEAAKLAGLPWSPERHKNDAEYNAALGKAYLKQQLNDFDGDLKLALAAYNAGPGAVRAAQEKAKKKGKAPFFENLSLPRETQLYVPKIIQSKKMGQIYQQSQLARR